MCMLTFDYPQTYAVTGSAEEQLAQLRSYIWQLVDVLNQMGDGEAEANSGRGTGAVGEGEELPSHEIVGAWDNA